MKTVTAMLPIALLLCGCQRTATMALNVAAATLEARSGAPPPQVVRVETKPIRCTSMTMGIYTTIDCN